MCYAQPITSYVPLATQIYGQELLSISSFLLGEKDLYYKESELHVRHPNYRHQIPSHQDNFYFGLKNPVALTNYIYLTEQDGNSGGLGFLPKMMQKTELHQPGKDEGFSSYHKSTENDPEAFVYPQTRPGDVVFHHCNTFHRANENTSDQLSASISTRVLSRSNLQKDQELQSIYAVNLKQNRGL